MKATRILSMAVALALAVSANAYAAKPGDNGNNNGPSTTNNNAYGGAGGNGTGVGIGIGQGGQGGAGGKGGSVIGSGNSSNLNNNSNKQNQGQAQGQVQGQSQSSKNSNSNKNQNANINGNANNNRSSATGGNSQASNSGNNSDQSVTVQGDNYEAYRIPVATAYAPNIAPTAVCMGSSSGGVQTQIVGVSLGTSWTDDNCMLLEQVRTVAAVLNDRETASEMMCDVAAYAAARERAGKPCGNVIKTAQATITTTAATKPVPRSSRYEGNDPIVRKRLGLPPLN